MKKKHSTHTHTQVAGVVNGHMSDSIKRNHYTFWERVPKRMKHSSVNLFFSWSNSKSHHIHVSKQRREMFFNSVATRVPTVPRWWISDAKTCVASSGIKLHRLRVKFHGLCLFCIDDLVDDDAPWCTMQRVDKHTGHRARIICHHFHVAHRGMKSVATWSSSFFLHPGVNDLSLAVSRASVIVLKGTSSWTGSQGSKVNSLHWDKRCESFFFTDTHTHRVNGWQWTLDESNIVFVWWSAITYGESEGGGEGKKGESFVKASHCNHFPRARCVKGLSSSPGAEKRATRVRTVDSFSLSLSQRRGHTYELSIKKWREHKQVTFVRSVVISEVNLS